MSQVKGSGKSIGEAQKDALKMADEYCKGGKWNQTGSWSCNQVSKDYWECNLWFKCEKVLK